MRFSDIVKDSE